MTPLTRSLLASLMLCLFTSIALAQEAPPEPTQDPNVPYRLFATTNVYTFIKLDTRDGRLWQVQ